MQKSIVLKDLEEFISIQSVSADTKRSEQMSKAVEFLSTKLEKLGFEIITDGNPIQLVIAYKKVEGAHNTIGIYGHYDVQSEDPVSEWHSDPYKLHKENGKLFARGVADNKGHIIQNMTAIEELIATDTLQNNIVFLIEGEEETGSEQFESLINKHAEVLKQVDVFFVTDTGMQEKNVPSILYALRGLVYFEIEVIVSSRDLHSGVYGNSVFNPAQVLTDLFSKMKDIHTGEILIPGFYNQVRKINDVELELLQQTGETDIQLQTEVDSKNITPFRNLPAYVVSKIFPSLDIHGFVSGYTGEGPKTIIPSKATAKFSCRLVENQQPDVIEEKIMLFVKENMPKGVKYNLKTISKDHPFYTSLDNNYVKRVSELLSDHFGNKTVVNRSGGSIPAAEILQRLFGKPIILTGFTLPDENIHAPDENFDEDMFWEGIEAFKKIYGDSFNN